MSEVRGEAIGRNKRSVCGVANVRDSDLSHKSQFDRSRTIVNSIEHMIGGARIYIDRVRRNGKIEKPEPDFVLMAGDVIGMAGRHEILIDHADKFGVEVSDHDLVQGSIDAVDVVVTQKKIDGMSLVELGNEPFARGVFLRGISRSGIALPVMPATIVERGDVLSIVGAPEPQSRRSMQSAWRTV